MAWPTSRARFMWRGRPRLPNRTEIFLEPRSNPARITNRRPCAQRCSMSGKSPIRLAWLHRTIAVCLVLVPFCAASDHWNYEESHDEVRDFVAGGMLHVRLGVGDLHIKRSD